MNATRAVRASVAGLCLVCLWAATASAWHYAGHYAVVQQTLPLLAGRVPAFFMAGSNTVSECAGDPDAFKDLSPGVLKPLEGPEHFIDYERLGENARLPAKRLDFIALCKARGIQASDVGFLPYAIMEWTERLKVAFAEHRRRPNDTAIQAKILVYAGNLAHYTADLSQPLHVTIHFDGRAGPKGQSPHSGIHNKVDALLGKADFEPDVLKGIVPVRLTNVAERVFAVIQDRAPIAAVYELEGRMPGMSDPIGKDPQVMAFCRDRLRVAASVTADLFLTAWEDSANVVFPEWFDQSQARGKSAP